MSDVFIGDVLGPRGRRRARIGSTIALVVIGLVVAAALKRFADKGQFAWERWEPLTVSGTMRFLLVGLENTIKAAAVSMVLAMAFGAVLALGRLAKSRVVGWIAGGYVELLRGTPLLLLLFFSARGLPKLGVDLPIFWYVVLALVAYNSAVLGEIFRAGILSLSKGQSEAAAAIGLTYWQGMRLVIIPQAARRMIPAIVSQLVTLLKDTSLGFVVGYEELLRRGDIAGEFGKNRLQALLVVAAMYMVVNMTLSQVARRLEVRQRRRFHAGSIQVSGVEDLTVVTAQGDADSK